MAIFVPVHGATGGGWHWKIVAGMLRAAGPDVYPPTFTGPGERTHLVSPDIDLPLHIPDIVAILRSEDLSDVILVGHSYAGLVITGVAEQAAERLAHLSISMPSSCLMARLFAMWLGWQIQR